MGMWLEECWSIQQRQKAMLQLHLRDRQFNCQLRCDLYEGFCGVHAINLSFFLFILPASRGFIFVWLGLVGLLIVFLCISCFSCVPTSQGSQPGRRDMALCWEGMVTDCVVGILALLYPVGLGPVGCQSNLPGRYWHKCGVRACLGGIRLLLLWGPYPTGYSCGSTLQKRQEQ